LMRVPLLRLTFHFPAHFFALGSDSSKLNRREQSVRRLLSRYHDNPRLLKQIVPKKKRHVGALLGHAANEEFDELKAQRVSGFTATLSRGFSVAI